jgi:flagellar export protein FliJ
MRFQFETLLQVHKNKENFLKKELGDILAHKQSQQNRSDNINSSMEKNIQEINQRMVQDLDINTYALYNNFFYGSHLQKDRQKTIISEVDLRAKTKRAELVEASRKRRTMEILKERYLKNHENKLAKLETEAMDEIASNHWSLNS